MINGTLTARKTNDDPPSYRVIFDDGTGPVEVGSVSRAHQPHAATARSTGAGASTSCR